MWKPEAVTSAGRGNHHDLLTTSATSTSSSESKKTDVSYLGSPQTKMEDRYNSSLKLSIAQAYWKPNGEMGR